MSGPEDAQARQAVVRLGREVLPALFFDDASRFFARARRRDDAWLGRVVRALAPDVHVPGLLRFNGRFALEGGGWRHLGEADGVESTVWETVTLSFPLHLGGDARYAAAARCGDRLRWFLVAPGATGGWAVVERWPEVEGWGEDSPRALRRPGVLAFLGAVAEVLASGLRVGPALRGSLVASGDGSDAPLHDPLRDRVFGDPRLVAALRIPDRDDALEEAWRSSLGRADGPPPRVDGRWWVDSLGCWPMGDSAPPADVLVLVRIIGRVAGSTDVAVVASRGPHRWCFVWSPGLGVDGGIVGYTGPSWAPPPTAVAHAAREVRDADALVEWVAERLRP